MLQIWCRHRCILCINTQSVSAYVQKHPCQERKECHNSPKHIESFNIVFPMISGPCTSGEPIGKFYTAVYQVIFCNKKWAKALAKDGLLFKARSPDLRTSFQLGQASIQFGCQNGPMKVSKNKNWKQKTPNLNVQPPQNEFWLSLIICGLFDADVRRKWRHGVRKSLAQICRPRWPIFGVKEF